MTIKNGQETAKDEKSSQGKPADTNASASSVEDDKVVQVVAAGNQNEDTRKEEEKEDVETSNMPVLSPSPPEILETADNEGGKKQEQTAENDVNKNKESAGNRVFPAAFYCPITKDVFQDPVVIPGGDTYERSAILERGDVPEEKLYPNRVLKEIVDEQVRMTGNSIGAGLYRLEHSLRMSLKQILETSTLPNEEWQPLSDAFYCPITFNLMFEPVIDPEGNTFERVAVEDWIRVNGMSPVTRTPIKVEDLYPNKAYSALLDEEKNKEDGSIHPAILKWKGEEPPKRITNDDIETDSRGNTGNPSSSPYPTTQEEMNRARSSSANRVFAIFGTLCLIFLLFLAFRVGNPILALFIAAICCIRLCESRRNR